MMDKKILQAAWPDNWNGTESVIKLDTKHLPDEVVSTPVTIGVYVISEEGSRNGGISVGIQYGDRENTQLSAEELEYVLILLDDAKRYVKDHFSPQAAP